MGAKKKPQITIDKALFLEKLQPYVDENIIRVVFATKHLCIVALGDLFYLSCNYMMVDGEPVGFFSTLSAIEKLIRDDKSIQSYYKLLLENPKSKSLFYGFAEDKMDFYKKMLKNKDDKGAKEVDAEKEKQFIAKRKRNRLVQYIILSAAAAVIAVLIVLGCMGCKHDYQEEIVYEATTSSTGLKQRICKKCNHLKTEIIPQLTE